MHSWCTAFCTDMPLKAQHVQCPQPVLLAVCVLLIAHGHLHDHGHRAFHWKATSIATSVQVAHSQPQKCLDCIQVLREYDPVQMVESKRKVPLEMMSVSNELNELNAG